MKDYQKRKLVEKAQEKAELFIYQNYEDIIEVNVNKKNYQFSPMGGLGIGGNVNGERDLYFNIMYDISNNRVGEVTSIVIPENFPSEKEECKNSFC